MISDVTLKKFLLRLAAAAAALGLAYLALRCVVWWLLPFLLAFGVAAALEPAIVYLQRRFRFRRAFSAAVLTLFLLFLAGGLLSFFFSTLFREANAFLAQAGAIFDRLSELPARILDRLEQYCALCPPWLEERLRALPARLAARSAPDAAVDALLAALGALAAALPRIMLACATTVLAVFFTASAYPTLKRALRERLPREMAEGLARLKSGLLRSLSRWLRAELTLSALTFAQLLAGFSLLRQEFPLLLAFLVAFVDALPVFGTGTVLVPWALLCLLLGLTPKALALLALYLSTLLVRNVLEPKLLARQAGLPPIASLAAMYLGFCSFGVGGMLLFPFLLLLLAQLRGSEKLPR